MLLMILVALTTWMPLVVMIHTTHATKRFCGNTLSPTHFFLRPQPFARALREAFDLGIGGITPFPTYLPKRSSWRFWLE